MLLKRSRKGVLSVIIPGLLAVIFGWLVLGNLQRSGGVTLTNLGDQVSAFASVFLGIFIEAAPYLLLGTLASGLVEVFFSREELLALVPRNPVLGSLFGAMMGLFFPVCECGVVPLTRRLFQKGLPPAMGIAFLLAAPVLNPIVIASTLAAFGPGPVFFGRMGLTLVIATLTGLIFSLQTNQAAMLKAGVMPEPVLTLPDGGQPLPVVKPPLKERLRRMLVIAGDEFFEMGRYLVIGAMLAALMQTVVPQGALLAFSSGPLVPVLVMIALAVLLSICSTVDAFIALAFAGAFSTGSLLAFLVFGPMVDIKSTLMFLRVFKRKTVAYLILLPLMMVIISGVAVNLFG
jgi:uncharacterized membrane protein YraQ (UPF0718 family)